MKWMQHKIKNIVFRKWHGLMLGSVVPFKRNYYSVLRNPILRREITAFNNSLKMFTTRWLKKIFCGETWTFKSIVSLCKMNI